MQIDDKTLSEWREFARRDDCLENMVPSQLRIILFNLQATEDERLELAKRNAYLEQQSGDGEYGR